MLDLITVADAARALWVSRSTVYRYDRVNGPFVIVTRGKRVFIDLRTFEDYVAARSVGTVNAVSTVPEEPRATERPEPPATRERTGSGQRDLFIPARLLTVTFHYC